MRLNEIERERELDLVHLSRQLFPVHTENVHTKLKSEVTYCIIVCISIEHNF